MFFENMIHNGPFWITACRKVPGFGFMTSSSEFSVTTYTLPFNPPVALRPKPSAHFARRLRFLAQFLLHLQHLSIGFVTLHGPRYFFFPCFRFLLVLFACSSKPASLRSSSKSTRVLFALPKSSTMSGFKLLFLARAYLHAPMKKIVTISFI